MKAYKVERIRTQLSSTKEVRTRFSQDLTEEEQQYLKLSYRVIPRTQMAKKLNVKKVVFVVRAMLVVVLVEIHRDEHYIVLEGIQMT